MKRICSLFSILLLALFLNGCGSNDDKTATTTGAGDDQTTKATTDAAAFSHKETFSSTGSAPKRGGGSTFRIKKKGTAFGKTIKVVFSNGWSVTVPNTSKRFTSGNFIYRAGGGSFRNAETWTTHGGVFLCANAGNKSKKVTIYY